MYYLLTTTRPTLGDQIAPFTEYFKHTSLVTQAIALVFLMASKGPLPSGDRQMTNYGERRGGGDRGAGGERGGREADEPDEDMHQDDGEYLMPDRDFYRKKITSFQNVHAYFESRLDQRSFRERQLLQPHYTAFISRATPLCERYQRTNSRRSVCTLFT